MAYDNEGTALIAGYFEKKLHHEACVRGIEGSCGLVRENDRGFVGQGAGDGHALTLAHGEG